MAKEIFKFLKKKYLTIFFPREEKISSDKNNFL